MAGLLIFGGPVNLTDIAGVDWGQTKPEMVLFNQGPDGGIGSSSFAALAESMRGSDGRILPNLLASKGLDRSQFDRDAISGFSAFHGLASALTASDPDLIDAAFLIDACFSAVDPNAWLKSGYVGFGAMAASGDRVMVYTASAGGGPTAPFPSSTGSQCMLANVHAAADAAGVPLFAYQPPAPLPPCDGLKAGSLVGLDYGPQFNSGFTHGDMINRWGVATLQAFAAPYFAGTLDLGGAWTKYLAFAAAAAAGYAGVRYLTSRK